MVPKEFTRAMKGRFGILAGVWCVIVFLSGGYAQDSTIVVKSHITGRSITVYDPCQEPDLLTLKSKDYSVLTLSEKRRLELLDFKCSQQKYGYNYLSQSVQYDSKQLFNQLGKYHRFMGFLTITGSIVGMIATARMDLDRPVWIYIAEGAGCCFGIWEFKLGSHLKNYTAK